MCIGVGDVKVNVLFLALLLILLARANVEDMPKVIFALDLSFQSLSEGLLL